MFDPEDLPVTTTDGHRPSTTVGDRLMVILAALALVGGALIAVSKLLPPSDATQTSDASATSADATTPAATASIRPTPTPRPLRSFQLTAGPPPEPPDEETTFSGWVRAIDDVPVRYSPSDDATIIDALTAGEAALIEPSSDQRAGGGWLYMGAPLQGWIQSEVDGHQVLDFADAHTVDIGWLERLVAGPDGFAALGRDPVSTADVGVVVAGSDDGRGWRPSDYDFGDAYAPSLAYGPAGWLLTQHIGGEDGLSSAWIWRSDDLLNWEPLGSFDASAAGEPGQLVASEAGYLMLVNWSNGYGSAAASVWFSTDGVLWSERIRPRSEMSGEVASLSATSLGFFAYGYDADGSPSGYFSGDGWTWSEAPLDFEMLAGVAAAGDQLMAVDRNWRGESRAWLGSLVGDGLTWTHDASSIDVFDGAFVTSVVSDGVTAMAIGWDRQTEAALYWILTSAGWERRAFPADYAGLPRIAAAGPAGYVVGGTRAGAVGLDPVVWHYAAGTWMPQTSGPIAAAPAPTADECSSLGTDLIDLMSINVMLYVTCFGDAPLTVRGWAQPCQDCYFGLGWAAEPRWLVEPSIDRVLHLAPIESDNVGWLDGVLSRSLKRDPHWAGNFLEVTGHFDDPAASRCRTVQGATYDEWYGGRQEIVNQCRGRFIVTNVRVLPTPT